ncbi:MAG TPA: hypothetical protein VLC46_26695 [Thermoanaerobaculia bacterium]|jgi:hypothetical protein|nr:hypothetical protein [Thermoanaerobaculia bacterium]
MADDFFSSLIKSANAVLEGYLDRDEELRGRTPLQKRLALAKSVLEVEKARVEFLKENGIEDGTPLADEVNVIFTDYAVRLRNPDPEEE